MADQEIPKSIPKCTSWLGHRFEGRYSSEPVEGSFPAMKAEGKIAIEAQVRMRCTYTYERDICVRCGHVIEKAKP